MFNFLIIYVYVYVMSEKRLSWRNTLILLVLHDQLEWV